MISVECKQSKVGCATWNKGKRGVYSEETRKKMSEAKIGVVPWNKGKKGVMPIPWNKEDPMDRFFKLITRTDFCWNWKGYRNKKGYGAFGLNRRSILAHRASWLLFNGDIKDKLCVLHKCDNPSCVNPDHLFLGTVKDNSDDMIKKGRDEHQKGEDHGCSYLKEDQVIKIRNEYKDGRKSQKELSKLFNTTQANISLIVNRKNWSHI